MNAASSGSYAPARIDLTTTKDEQMSDPNYDSDVPISEWAGSKRGIMSVSGSVYNAPVTIHIHVHRDSKSASKSNKRQKMPAIPPLSPGTADYLAQIAGKIPI